MNKIIIQVVSDLHFEFYSSFFTVKEFISSLRKESSANIIVLAGDIATKTWINSILEIFSENWEHVIFVCGNHEYYGSSFREIHDLLSSVPENVHILNDSSFEIDNFRFLGSTLWFEYKERSFDDRYMNDFHRIINISNEVGKIHENTVEYLKNSIQQNDIVITHHLPCFESVDPRYKDHHLTKYFYSPMEDIIVNTQPQLWIHGHTHSSCDYMFHKTRIVCNPFGYVGYTKNDSFSKILEVEIASKD